jgi:amino acid transporter
MKLNNSFFWAGLIFVAFLFFLLFYVFSGDLKFASISNAFVVLTVVLLSAASISVLLALLVSVFSIKKKKFKKEFRFIVPLIFISVLLLFAFLGFIYKKGEEYSGLRSKFLVSYRDVQCPPGLNYASIKTGSYFTKYLEIERNDSTQIQKDNIDNSTQYYHVAWLSPCEYMLTDQSNADLKVFVKVTAVDESSYSCYFTSDTTSIPTFFMRIQRK